MNTARSSCLMPDEMVMLVDGEMDALTRNFWHEHMRRCRPCQTRHRDIHDARTAGLALAEEAVSYPKTLRLAIKRRYSWGQTKRAWPAARLWGSVLFIVLCMVGYMRLPLRPPVRGTSPHGADVGLYTHIHLEAGNMPGESLFNKVTELGSW